MLHSSEGGNCSRIVTSQIVQSNDVVAESGKREGRSKRGIWPDGRRARARDLLALIYRWFAESFETHDLNEATGLLDELR